LFQVHYHIVSYVEKYANAKTVGYQPVTQRPECYDAVADVITWFMSPFLFQFCQWTA